MPARETQGGGVGRPGRRFGFGSNWRRFLAVLDDERIVEAEGSLRTMMGLDRLAGKTFVDVGCGSGLFSLAAMRLGAARVHSFDYDMESVACAEELRRRHFPSADTWSIEIGDVLDADYVKKLGEWDIVYSWGVLHHTGDVWQALENAMSLVAEPGLLFISIYNDQGRRSRVWRRIKVAYNSGSVMRMAILTAFAFGLTVRGLLVDAVRLRNPVSRYREYKRARGMSMVHDWVDWLGGYPFEVARPESVFEFCRGRGFVLEKLRTCGGGLGCNEFVFSKPSITRPAERQCLERPAIGQG